jgi:hypothetical protein
MFCRRERLAARHGRLFEEDRMRTILACLTLAVGATVTVARPASAQLETATVIGTLIDAQDARLPGATITARNVDTGFTRSGVSDADGRYRLPAVPPGRYEFTAELSGFTTALRSGVTLAVGSETVINFQLVVGNLSEQVQVTAEAPVVETTTAAVQGTIDRTTIDTLPMIGRDYTSLLRLIPGAQNSNGVSFTGSRGRSNQWIIDGVDNSEDISGLSRQTPALDSIREVQVVVNGFKAEYGSASGGVVNVITESGTNDFKGSGFFLFRDQDLMARSPYANRSLPKDPFQRLNYGGTIGGPLVRDRMHFFATYEREDRDTFTSSTRTLPASTAAFAPSTLQFLRQNGIDVSLFGAGGSVRQVRPEYVDVHKVTGRVDTQFNAAQSLTVRYTMDHETDPSGLGGTLFDYNGATAFFRTNYVAANHKWILSPSMLNEAYVQFGQTFGDWYVSFPTLTNLDITGGFTLGGASNYPQGRTDYVYQFVDNLSWTMTGTRTGEHAFKAGAQVKIFKSDSFFDSNFRGTYTFPSLNAFIQGTPSRFTQNQGDTTLARPNQIYGFYIQDDWRPTAGWTFNLGLRYDFEGAKTEALRDVTGEAGAGISGDRNNFAPRFGFAWAPGATTKHVFYGGTGLYYDQVILNIIGNARFTPPKVIGIQIDNPAWPDPFAGGAASIPPPSLSVIDENLRTGYNWNTQVGYRRELMTDLGVDVSFVYNRGYDQVGIVNTNAGIPGTASLTGANPVRPDPTVVNKSLYTNLGEIRYKGLLVEVTKRFSRRVQASANYTLSKTEDNAFNFVSTIQVPERPDLNWGPGDEDRRHRFAGSAVVTLPFDVQFGAIVEYRSEPPLNITAGGRDLNGDGITGDWVNSEICRNPAVNCAGSSYSRNSVRELSTEEANRLRALFGLAPIERFENNPKYFNADVTLQKTVSFSGQRLRLTAEAINVFNVPQRTYGSTSILGAAASFGQYTAVDQPRAVQFTLQYYF